MVKVRINPLFLDEFKGLIETIPKKDYKEKNESKNIQENKNNDEFKDWKYEYCNSTQKYYKYPIFIFTLTDIVIEVLTKIFGKCNKQSLWYKKEENLDKVNIDIDETDMTQNKYTIYVISKGRWMYNYTIKSLIKIGITNYKLVIEEEELDQYINSGIDVNKIICFNNIIKNNSGIPVRNFVWEHSILNKETRHWILDDNIDGFFRWNRNKRELVNSPYTFRQIEDYTDTKKNVMICGMNYFCFNPNIDYTRKIFIKNTRIYSCILLNNFIPKLDEKWRGIFNEDTDLSLRVLKLGYGTLLFNNYLCGKKTTGTMNGGNKLLYDNFTQEGYRQKTQSLIDQHPNLVSFCKRFKKEFHHIVNYKPFINNKLI